jgi:hypothetical protein
LRAIAFLFLIAAFAKHQYFIDLFICSGITLVGSIAIAGRRASFLLEVYDCGSFLKLKLDADELLVNLFDIDKMEIRDGKDGLDWVVMHLRFESKFGRRVQFYPDMLHVPMGTWIIGVPSLMEKFLLRERLGTCSRVESTA